MEPNYTEEETQRNAMEIIERIYGLFLSKGLHFGILIKNMRLLYSH
jgi:hypothetical protein